MANNKLTLARVDTDNLVANLRGEVGEVITTWLLMRHFMAVSAQIRSDDPNRDFANRDLQFVGLLTNKLGDELVGRLSELAENKIGQLTFYFAACKIGECADGVKKFSEYVVKQKIRDKRNRDVSHKKMPGHQPGDTYLNIDYRVLLRGVALALRLMKRIDRHVLGPSAPFGWREMRKKRYEFMSPPKAGYILLPYLHLSGDDRIKILQQELDEGRKVLSEMPTMINGQPATVLASKKWGVIILGDRALALQAYPLNTLQALNIDGDIGSGSGLK